MCKCSTIPRVHVLSPCRLISLFLRSHYCSTSRCVADTRHQIGSSEEPFLQLFRTKRDHLVPVLADIPGSLRDTRDQEMQISITKCLREPSHDEEFLNS